MTQRDSDLLSRIIRYCELDNYQPHSLCAMKVSFHMTYVSNATSNCR